jgi:hypothetical protein
VRPADEQIVAILSGQTSGWARAQLAPGQSMDDRRYSDFIRVTPDEIEEYVRGKGFPGTYIVEAPLGHTSAADDQVCIVEQPSGWEVYYTERGVKSETATFTTHVEARREVIRRMVELAKVTLNHRYRYAHPEPNLPPPSEMDG